MNIAIKIYGDSVVGVLCAEANGKRLWSKDEEDFLCKLIEPIFSLMFSSANNRDNN